MANQIARYLAISVTQGGVDTFTQASVATDLIPADGFAFKLVHADVQISNATLSALGADFKIDWVFTRDTKAALANLSDPDVIFGDGLVGALVTSGFIALDTWHRYEFPEGVYIVEPTLYAHLASAGTALAIAMNARLYYEEVRLSEVEILRLLNNA